MTAKQLAAVYVEAATLLLKHGLLEDGWKFELSNHKTFLGECNYTDKIISLSKYFLNSPPEQITDTLLHEIAHALAGYKAGHNRLWRERAIAIGAKPERCTNSGINSAKPNYVLVCGFCQRRWPRYRIKFKHPPKCGHCHTELTIIDLRR